MFGYTVAAAKEGEERGETIEDLKWSVRNKRPNITLCDSLSHQVTQDSGSIGTDFIVIQYSHRLSCRLLHNCPCDPVASLSFLLFPRSSSNKTLKEVSGSNDEGLRG